MGSVTFELLAPHEPSASQLLDAMESHLVHLYGPLRDPVSPDAFLPPDGGYLVGFQHGRPIAGGGFIRHSRDTAEIRRMFVTPVRRQGIGRRLLTVVENAAGRAGYDFVLLDTGSRQPEAEQLYRTSGYSTVPPYPGSARLATYWGRKDLRDDR